MRGVRVLSAGGPTRVNWQKPAPTVSVSNVVRFCPRPIAVNECQPGRDVQRGPSTVTKRTRQTYECPTAATFRKSLPPFSPRRQPIHSRASRSETHRDTLVLRLQKQT